ncbi:unnamed protein product, partial [Ectocarpus sp. 13 AM-2016]
MEKISWEVEYGPDEYHIWDTLNTPLYNNLDYAPIPSGDGNEETFIWPLKDYDGVQGNDAEGYYSVMYSGPFPPLQCADELHPADVAYEGCYDAGIFGTTTGTTGNGNDPAENYRMYDGIGDMGVQADDKVMTLDKCADKCKAEGASYFGLESAVKCLCGDNLVGNPTTDSYGDGGSVCGIGITFGGDVPEYKYLCSGDSRVL